ncbi:MAG: hypothetical protein H7175_19650 [Burkholderiales bacterium]|nr:hypothetical protein [Anaerolineae bacterium]
MEAVRSVSVSVYDELFDFIIEKVSPEEVLAFRASPKVQERAAYLTDQNNAGKLTDKEAVELKALMDLTLLVSVLKARALEKMS